MKYLLLSISLLWLGIHHSNGHSLSKVELKQPSNIIYKVTEDKYGETISISNPNPERPTLREIIYYHIIEKAYGGDESGQDPEVTIDFDETRRPFTNGQGYQFFEQFEPGDDAENSSSSDDASNEDVAIDARKDKTSQEDTTQDEGAEKTRRKREVSLEQPKSEVQKPNTRARLHRRYLPERRLKRYSRRQPLTSASAKLDLDQLPKYLQNLLSKSKSKDVKSIAKNKEPLNNIKVSVNTIVEPNDDDKVYGMDLMGDKGIVWNKLNKKYAYLVGDILDDFADESNEANTDSGYDSTSGSDESNSSESQEDTDSGSEELTEDSDEEDAGSSSVEDQEDSSSTEDDSGSDENESESEEGTDDNESGEYTDDLTSGSDEEDTSGESGEYGEEINSEESGEDGLDYGDGELYSGEDSNEFDSDEDFSFNDIINDLHNIFVENNSSIEISPDDIGMPENINMQDFLFNIINKIKEQKNRTSSDIIINPGGKDSNSVNVMEGLFTNIIKDNIIINNNVPFNPSANIAHYKDETVSSTETPTTKKNTAASNNDVTAKTTDADEKVPKVTKTPNNTNENKTPTEKNEVSTNDPEKPDRNQRSTSSGDVTATPREHEGGNDGFSASPTESNTEEPIHGDGTNDIDNPEPNTDKTEDPRDINDYTERNRPEKLTSSTEHSTVTTENDEVTKNMVPDDILDITKNPNEDEGRTERNGSEEPSTSSDNNMVPDDIFDRTEKPNEENSHTESNEREDFTPTTESNTRPQEHETDDTSSTEIPNNQETQRDQNDRNEEITSSTEPNTKTTKHEDLSEEVPNKTDSSNENGRTESDESADFTTPSNEESKHANDDKNHSGPDENPDKTEKADEEDRTEINELPEVTTVKPNTGDKKLRPPEIEKQKDETNSPNINKQLDNMLDLINNEKFWKFMGDLAGKYLEKLMESTSSLIKREIENQLKEHLDALKRENAIKENHIKNSDKPTTSSDIEENVTPSPKKRNGKEDKHKKDKDNVEVKAEHLYGSAVGNDKVTNVYIFDANKNVDDIMKYIEQLNNKNNSTNIFTVLPQQNKPDDVNKNKSVYEPNKDEIIPTDAAITDVTTKPHRVTDNPDKIGSTKPNTEPTSTKSDFETSSEPNYSIPDIEDKTEGNIDNPIINCEVQDSNCGYEHRTEPSIDERDGSDETTTETINTPSSEDLNSDEETEHNIHSTTARIDLEPEKQEVTTESNEVTTGDDSAFTEIAKEKEIITTEAIQTSSEEISTPEFDQTTTESDNDLNHETTISTLNTEFSEDNESTVDSDPTEPSITGEAISTEGVTSSTPESQNESNEATTPESNNVITTRTDDDLNPETTRFRENNEITTEPIDTDENISSNSPTASTLTDKDIDILTTTSSNDNPETDNNKDSTEDVAGEEITTESNVNATPSDDDLANTTFKDIDRDNIQSSTPEVDLEPEKEEESSESKESITSEGHSSAFTVDNEDITTAPITEETASSQEVTDSTSSELDQSTDSNLIDTTQSNEELKNETTPDEFNEDSKTTAGDLVTTQSAITDENIPSESETSNTVDDDDDLSHSITTERNDSATTRASENSNEITDINDNKITTEAAIAEETITSEDITSTPSVSDEGDEDLKHISTIEPNVSTTDSSDGSNEKTTVESESTDNNDVTTEAVITEETASSEDKIKNTSTELDQDIDTSTDLKERTTTATNDNETDISEDKTSTVADFVATESTITDEITQSEGTPSSIPSELGQDNTVLHNGTTTEANSDSNPETTVNTLNTGSADNELTTKEPENTDITTEAGETISLEKSANTPADTNEESSKEISKETTKNTSDSEESFENNTTAGTSTTVASTFSLYDGTTENPKRPNKENINSSEITASNENADNENEAVVEKISSTEVNNEESR